MKRTVPLTRTELRRILDYNRNTGYFYWKVKPGKRVRIGARAGAKTVDGYRIIRYQGVSYREQHLAWFYHYGFWPRREMDHINRVRDDNRLCNLRAATVSQNRANSLVSSRSKLGVKGVRMTPCNRFTTHISKHGRFQYLGTYDTLEEAVAVHTAAHRELYGKFSPAHNQRP